MSKPETAEHGGRHATLKLGAAPSGGQQLSARVPGDITDEEFGKVAKSAYALIHKLTGCNCMSGRISFVVEDHFAEVIRVDFGQVAAAAAAKT